MFKKQQAIMISEKNHYVNPTLTFVFVWVLMGKRHESIFLWKTDISAK